MDYIYLGDQPIATFTPSSAKLAFLHSDRLGTPQIATNSAKAVVWSANYQPFGTINAATSNTATLAQDLRFPGQENDVETGLYHNGFRLAQTVTLLLPGAWWSKGCWRSRV